MCIASLTDDLKTSLVVNDQNKFNSLIYEYLCLKNDESLLKVVDYLREKNFISRITKLTECAKVMKFFIIEIISEQLKRNTKMALCLIKKLLII